jgi:hypothetical protein
MPSESSETTQTVEQDTIEIKHSRLSAKQRRYLYYDSLNSDGQQPISTR